MRTAARLQNAEIELSGLRRAYRGLLGTQRANRDRVNALNEEITALRLAMIDHDRRGGADALTARAFAVTMAAVLDERDRAARRARVLDTRVADLSRKLGTTQRRQETMIARIETATPDIAWQARFAFCRDQGRSEGHPATHQAGLYRPGRSR